MSRHALALGALGVLALAPIGCDDTPAPRSDVVDAATLDGLGSADAGDAGDVGDAATDADDVPEARLAEELYPGVYALAGLDPALPRGELDALWAMVDGFEIVGLGESVHTSGGFYAAKHRLVRDLVSARGLRVFAMETPRSAARRLDDFIQGGDCDADPLTVFAPPSPIFGVFIDDHTAALFAWLCDWNVAHPEDRVRFFGFDAQQPEDDTTELRAFAEAHAPERRAALDAGLAACSLALDDRAITEDDHAACLASLDAWGATLDTLGAPARELAEARMALRSLRSWQDQAFYTTTRVRTSWEARDVAMADLFEARLALDFPDQRVIVWAHNYHLAADHPSIMDTPFVAAAKTLGSELRARRGAAYQSVAITAYRPGIDWPGVSDGPETLELGATSGAFERLLYEGFDAPVIAYDTTSQWTPPEASYELSQETMVPSAQYEAILFLRDSAPMDALLW